MVYEPAEDSVLLKRNIGNYAKGKVLDMGTGSGILAEEAKKYASSVTGADIGKEAVEYCKNRIRAVNFIQSDLFSNINEKFDTILFNPPYLPSKE
ncbi:MAG: HemK2/MTQ2 family protein methyltransferase [Nanoarchaeota archaeon]